MPVSLNPKDAIKGGLVTDVDGVLIEIKFEQNFTYPNSTATTCAAVGKIQLDGGDIVDPVFWSVGKPEDYTVSEDGAELESVKGHTGVGDNSNFNMFATELINAGFPANKLSGRLDVLVGLKAHWEQKAQPKRSGLASTSERERTSLVPTKILQLPWEKSATKSTAATKSGKANGAATTTATPAASDIENEAAMMIAGGALDILKTEHAGKKISKPEWTPRSLNALSKLQEFKDADGLTKAAVTRLMKNADYLGMNDIAVDGTGAVQLPAA